MPKGKKTNKSQRPTGKKDEYGMDKNTTSGKYSRGPKTYSKGNLAPDEQVSTHKSKDNDVSWYAQDPQLLKDVARFSFAQVAGLKMENILADLGISGSEGYQVQHIPGIMKICLEPSLGAGKITTDAPSVAARNLYTFVRHANSGSANYEAADLYMMVLAHASAQSWLEELKRLYGLATLYSTRNRYLGKILVTTLGYNYDNVAANLPALRTLINLNARKLNSIKIPSSIPLADRWNWISRNFYSDADSPKAQYYIYQFQGYFKFDGYGSQTGTRLLVTRPFKNQISDEISDLWNAGEDESLLTIHDLIEYTNNLIAPLWLEEDVGIMSGDIMKAFGEAVTSVSGIDDNYQILPAYSTEVLNQIHNTKFVGLPKNTLPTNHNIAQLNGSNIREYCEFNLQANPTTNDEAPLLEVICGNFLYDAYAGMTNPEDVMVGSRLIPVVSAKLTDATPRLSVDKCGSEIPLCAIIYNIASVDNGNMYMYRSKLLAATPTNVVDSIIGAVSCFDWHPRVLPYYKSGSSITYQEWLGDLEDYTVINNNNLSQLHDVAILSEMAYSKKTSLN